MGCLLLDKPEACLHCHSFETFLRMNNYDLDHYCQHEFDEWHPGNFKVIFLKGPFVYFCLKPFHTRRHKLTENTLFELEKELDHERDPIRNVCVGTDYGEGVQNPKHSDVPLILTPDQMKWAKWTWHSKNAL